MTRVRVSLRDPGKANMDAQPLPPVPRRAGRITIDNERYGRYAGELQMTLVDLPPDDRVNVIGEVIEEDVSLLRFVHGGRRFCLIRW